MSLFPFVEAIGRIEPTAPVRVPIAACLDAIEADPSTVLVGVEPSAHPAGCMDGRPWEVGGSRHFSGPLAAPRCAGATITTWVTDLLVTGAFRPSPTIIGAQVDDFGPASPPTGDDLRALTPAWLSLLCAALDSHGGAIGTHSSDLAHEPSSGCAAADALGSLLGLIAQRPPALDALLRTWQVDPSALSDQVLSRCASLALTVPSGSTVVGILSGHAKGPIPVMQGPHAEVAVIVNTRRGTTVDAHALGMMIAEATATSVPADVGCVGRPAGEVSAGPAQVFVIDTWCFEVLADFLADVARQRDGVEADRATLVAVAAAFNAAALLALVGPGMPMAVLR